MRTRLRHTAGLATALVLIAGCKKTADNTTNYKKAINNYLATNQSCLWPEPQKLPAQITTSDTEKTAGFDALYNQGLLNRTTAEKKKLLGLIDKQVTNYDLSPKGKSAWTASTSDPSFGNFCYGHREVSSIDSANPNAGQPGAVTGVAYHYTFSSVPDWAKDAGVQSAFPNVAQNLAGGTGTATLIDTNNGWQVQAPASHAVSNSDGAVVQ